MARPPVARKATKTAPPARGNTSEYTSPGWNEPQRAAPENRAPKDSPILAISARMDRMTTALVEINEILDAAVREMRSTPDDVMPHLARFFHLKTSYDALDDARKAVGKHVEFLKTAVIPELLRHHGVSSVNMDDLGVRIGMTSRISASMLDKDAGQKWLKENGYEDIVVETVNASTLGALAKSLIEEEGRDLPEDLFKVSASTTTSVTKLAKK